MPSSSPHIIPVVCEKILREQPRSILDIGIGFGKYGLLAAEYTDVIHERRNFPTRIDGIEIKRFRLDAHELHDAIYWDVYEGDAVEILPSLKHRYDLIICVDVLEHMLRERGELMLERIRAASKSAIITTPVTMLPQGTTWGNKYETHVCQWSKAQLQVYGTVVQIGEFKPTWVLTMP